MAESLKAELAPEWGINPGSGKQLIEHFKLEGRQGWPKTKGGKPKTDQEAMKRLTGEDPSVAKWIEWKEIEKICSTYGSSILDKLSPETAACARGSTLSARRRDASPPEDWAMRHLRYVHRCKRHPRTCARPLGTWTGALCNFRKL
jgi:hypothetical protein